MLRVPPQHIVIDDITATTVDVVDGAIRIEGYGEFLPEQVLECYNACPVDCTENVRTVTVTVPESCICPYEWYLKVRSIACTAKYDIQTTFDNSKVYQYTSPDGATPTATVIKDAIVAQVNRDPFRTVNAASTGATTFTLTERDCDSAIGTCGFEAYVTSGTVANTTPHVDAIFPAYRLKQTLPIQWGMQGADPALARCGSYCVFYFHIRGGDIQDIDMNRTYGEYDREVYFYVNPDDADYETAWLDVLAGEVECLTT
jgi:hypothetical protein